MLAFLKGYVWLLPYIGAGLFFYGLIWFGGRISEYKEDHDESLKKHGGYKDEQEQQ